MNNLVGRQLGKYLLTRLIGEGGMASVYEGKHVSLSTKVAIKILNPALSSNTQLRERFKNEATLMASLNHPNITKVIDYDEIDGLMIIYMELLEGMDMSDLIKKVKVLDDKVIILYFEQILSAMQYAHENGVIHRDIKPSNIIILPDNTVKILDFGIAKLFGQGNEMTQTGTQMGTPIYMSPEQVKGEKSIDHRSDIYSLGVALYFAICGTPPYKAENTSQFDIFNKIVHEPLPEIPNNTVLGQMVKKACAKDKANRFQSCSEWLEILTELKKNPKHKPILKIEEEIIDNKIGQPAPPKVSPAKPKSNYLAFYIIGSIVAISLIFGFWYFKDTDGDGVIDRDDHCVEDYGSKLANGCPDSDNDGVQNAEDNCPDAWGDLYGCPDQDNDRVADKEDNCPNDAGNTNLHGCPDRDDDGIPDNEDSCPDVVGKSSAKGCPDDDGDGVANNIDNCPNDYGTISNSGCPQSNYKTECPYCRSTSYESQFNITWTCGSCNNTYWGCKRKGSDVYGIKQGWKSDGACDCEDCSDE